MFSSESLYLLQEDIKLKKNQKLPPPKPKFSNTEMTLKEKRKFQPKNVEELEIKKNKTPNQKGCLKQSQFKRATTGLSYVLMQKSIFPDEERQQNKAGLVTG